MLKFILAFAFFTSPLLAETFMCQRCEVFKPDPKPEPKPEPEPEPEPTGKCLGTASVCKIEALIVQKTNDLRKSQGKKPFGTCHEAAYAARDWSTTMANKNKISHDGFPTARAAAVKAKFGFYLSFRAENVAMFGQGNITSDFEETVASKFVSMWWNSSGHRRNMLADLDNMGAGVAVVDGSQYIKLYATELMLNQCSR